MLRVMILGCGGIAPAHIEGYLAFPEEAKITVLVNRDVSRAEGLKERYGLTEAIAVSDYRPYLAEVDAVSICTPPGTHEEMAVASLETGCHVLLEKPMAPSLAACDHILDAAKKSGKTLSVVVQSRFISNIRNVIDMVRSGAYGKSLFTQINSMWYRGEQYYDLAWRGRWTVEGGGCTFVHSIHHIDLLLWAKGLPTSVRSVMTNLGHHNSEEEDCSLSTLFYPDGTLAQVNSMLVAHGEKQQLTFQTERAGLTIPFEASVSALRSNGYPLPDENAAAAVRTDFESRPKLPYENHTGQVRDFLDAVLYGRPLVASREDGRNCIELITAIYHSAVTGTETVLPISEDDLYYTDAWKNTAPHFFEKHSDIAAFKDTTITDFKNKF